MSSFDISIVLNGINFHRNNENKAPFNKLAPESLITSEIFQYKHTVFNVFRTAYLAAWQKEHPSAWTYGTEGFLISLTPESEETHCITYEFENTLSRTLCSGQWVLYFQLSLCPIGNKVLLRKPSWVWKLMMPWALKGWGLSTELKFVLLLVWYSSHSPQAINMSF